MLRSLNSSPHTLARVGYSLSVSTFNPIFFLDQKRGLARMQALWHPACSSLPDSLNVSLATEYQEVSESE